VVKGSERDQLQGRMSFCREAEGTGDLGNSQGQAKDPRPTAFDV
jgi:hypothetical protein